MAFDGYFRYDGIEIVNSARTSAYSESMRLGFLKVDNQCGSLDAALGSRGWSNSDYETPGTGNIAPWYDPVEPASANFIGATVLDVQNIVSSTRNASVTESVSDGGWVSSGRYGTRSVVFRVLLAGTDMRAVQHGLNWLSTVLRKGDPCRNSLRTKHTYDDFLPLGKLWWTSYGETGPTALPDNLYQANRYLGLSITDAAEAFPGEVGTGNTYAKLHSGGEDGFSADALDMLVRLDLPDPVAAFSPECHGSTLEYFLQCPDAGGADDSYRYMTSVELESGPTVIGERVLGGPSCTTGAWMEVEFTLTAANPFVWRAPRDLLLFDATLSYSDMLTDWQYYKETADLMADNDLFQAPVVAGRPQTYADLYYTMFNRASGAARASDTQVRHPSPLALQDPTCPALPVFPGAPQESFLCRPLNEIGPFNFRRYSGASSTLPRFSPAAVKITMGSVGSEYRDIRLRIVPEGFVDDPGAVVELHVLYMPAYSTLVIDGARKSMDMLIGGESAASLLRWEPAEHLVVTHGGGATYRYPEIVCGQDILVEVGIPVGQNADMLTVGIEAILRDA